jgi:DNA-binding NarL/FixJ family response regulator
MRVMIIADDPRTVPALKFLLRYQPGIAAVDHIGVGAELAQQMECAHPDVLLIDRDSSQALVDAALDACRRRPHACAVIVLSSKDDVELNGGECGVDAFIAKSEPPDQLLALLHEIRLLRDNNRPT